MDDLRRAAASNARKPFGLPLPAGGIREDEDEEDAGPEPEPEPEPEPDDGDSSSASSMSSAGTIVAAPSAQLQRAAQPPAAASWHDYFDQELFLDTDGDGTLSGAAQYHVYVKPPADAAKDPVFVCHHGAGACGLSFALLAKEMKQLLPRAGVVAVEAREHGSVVAVPPGGTPDLALDTLARDLLAMMDLTWTRLGWPRAANLVLVGHSLGGAVVTRVARDGALGDRLLAYAVIDVVEGSAMDALASMQAYLRSRPALFPSVDAAIDWHVRGRTVRNRASARVSTPPLLVPAAGDSGAVIWRTDLSATSHYWHDWFGGMSAAFLTPRAGKLLLLAGTDRLDKQLMVGQMQGRFQLLVWPDAGHFVHEDLPARTADALVDLWRRNDGAALVLPPKVSALLAAGKKV